MYHHANLYSGIGTFWDNINCEICKSLSLARTSLEIKHFLYCIAGNFRGSKYSWFSIVSSWFLFSWLLLALQVKVRSLHSWVNSSVQPRSTKNLPFSMCLNNRASAYNPLSTVSLHTHNLTLSNPPQPHTLTSTSPECRNRLWGIMTAPTTPRPCETASDVQFAHIGITAPLKTSNWLSAIIAVWMYCVWVGVCGCVCVRGCGCWRLILKYTTTCIQNLVIYIIMAMSAISSLLPKARVGGHGYSSMSVFLFVCSFQSAHLAAIALRLQHGWPSHNISGRS